MSKLSEQDIARTVVDFLKKSNHKVYQEVRSYERGPVADIVAVTGPVHWVIETKTSLNFDVFEQAVFWLRRAHRVSICVPRSRRNRDFASEVCSRFGIGVLTVSPWGVREDLAPEFRRRVGLPIELREAQASGEYAAAGSAAGGHWTPFRETCINLSRAVALDPGKPLSEYLKHIQHHYANTSSARSSLMKWIDMKKVDGVRLKDGVLVVAQTPHRDT